MLLVKIKQRLRWLRMRAAFAVGRDRPWLNDRPGLRILVYHGVLPDLPRRINARFVTTAQFDEHCAYCKRHFQVISLDQAFAGEYDPQKFAVAFSFDDGYLNNLEHALPILQRHQIPASFFVTAPRRIGQDILWADLLDIASAIGKQPVIIGGIVYRKNRKGEYVNSMGKRLKQDCKDLGAAFVEAMVLAFADQPFQQDRTWDGFWKLMDANELRILSEAPGMTVGGHGTRHYNLDLLPIEDAHQDVEMGVQWLQAAIGKPVKTFAYPDGGYSPQLVEALAASGIHQQLLMDYRFEDQHDARLKDRFTIHPFLPTKVLMAEILRGRYF